MIAHLEIEMADDDTVSSAPAADTAPSHRRAESPAPSPPPSTETSTEPGTVQGKPARRRSQGGSGHDRDATFWLRRTTRPLPRPTEPDSQDQAETEEPKLRSDDDEQLPEEVDAARPQEIQQAAEAAQASCRPKLTRSASPAAEIGAELETFAKTNDLSGDDIANALHIAAMLRAGDYRVVLQGGRTLRPHGAGVSRHRPAEGSQRACQAGQMTEDGGEGLCAAALRRPASRVRTAGPRRRRYSASSVQAVQGDVQRAVSSFELGCPRAIPTTRRKHPPFGGSRRVCCWSAATGFRPSTRPWKSPRPPTTKSTSRCAPSSPRLAPPTHSRTVPRKPLLLARHRKLSWKQHSKDWKTPDDRRLIEGITPNGLHSR